MSQYDLEQYSDSLDWEMKLYQQSQGYQLNKPMITQDHNWQALKEERQRPFVPDAVIERVSNISLVLFANSEYQKGNLQCDIYKQGIKQPYTKNLMFEVKPELTPRQYKVWDLLITLCQMDLSGCSARRAKIFDAHHAENYSAEFGYFEIWRNQELVWACLVVEDFLLPMRIKLDEYQSKGDYRLTCAWKNKIAIEDWYKENL
jgi:hypothetical protein